MATRHRPLEADEDPFQVVGVPQRSDDCEYSFNVDPFPANRRVLSFEGDDSSEEESPSAVNVPAIPGPSTTDRTPFTKASEIESVLNQQFPYPKPNRMASNMLDHYLHSVGGPIFSNKTAAKAFLYASFRLEGTERIKRERLERCFAALLDDWRPHAITLGQLHERDQQEIFQITFREQKYRSFVEEEEVEEWKEEVAALAMSLIATKLGAEGLSLDDLPYLTAFEDDEAEERAFLHQVEHSEREEMWVLFEDQLEEAMLAGMDDAEMLNDVDGGQSNAASNTMSHQSTMSGTYSAASLRRQSQLYYHTVDAAATTGRGGGKSVVPLTVADLRASRSVTPNPNSPEQRARAGSAGTQSYMSRWEDNSLRLFSHTYHKSSRTFESDCAAHDVIKKRVGMKELGDARRADAAETKRITAQRTKDENLRLRRALEMSKRAELQKCFAHVVKSRDHFKNQRKLFDASREEYQRGRRRAAGVRYMAYKWELHASKLGADEAAKLATVMGLEEGHSRPASTLGEQKQPPMTAMHMRAIAGLAPLPAFIRPPSSQIGSRPPTRPTRLAPLSRSDSQRPASTPSPTRPVTAHLISEDGAKSSDLRIGAKKVLPKAHYFTNMPVAADGSIVRQAPPTEQVALSPKPSLARRKLLPTIIHPVEAKMVQLCQTFALMLRSGMPVSEAAEATPQPRILFAITAPTVLPPTLFSASANGSFSLAQLLQADQHTVEGKGSYYEQAAWYFIKAKEMAAAEGGLPEADKLLLAGEKVMTRLLRVGSDSMPKETEYTRSISYEGPGDATIAHSRTIHSLRIIRGKSMAAVLKATRQLTQALKTLEEVAELEAKPFFTTAAAASPSPASKKKHEPHHSLAQHPPVEPYRPYSTSPLRSPREDPYLDNTALTHHKAVCPYATATALTGPARLNPHNKQPEDILQDYSKGVLGGTFGRARKPIGDGDRWTKAAADAAEAARLHTPPRSPTRNAAESAFPIDSHENSHQRSPNSLKDGKSVPNPITLTNLATMSVSLGKAAEGIAYGRQACKAVTTQLEENIEAVLSTLRAHDADRRAARKAPEASSSIAERTINLALPYHETVELAVSALTAVASAQASQGAHTGTNTPSEHNAAPTSYRLAADLADSLLGPEHPMSAYCRKCLDGLGR